MNRTIAKVADPGLVAQFSEALHRRVIEIVNEKYVDEIGVGALFPVLTKADYSKMGFGRGGVLRSPWGVLNIGVDVRDRDFAVSAFNIACELKNQHPRLFVLVGSAHSPGVHRWLTKFGVPPDSIEIVRSDSVEGKARVESLIQSVLSARP